MSPELDDDVVPLLPLLPLVLGTHFPFSSCVPFAQFGAAAQEHGSEATHLPAGQ